MPARSATGGGELGDGGHGDNFYPRKLDGFKIWRCKKERKKKGKLMGNLN